MRLIIQIEREGKRSLQMQIYDGIRDGILSGTIRPGDQLPVSRVLAEQLSVSRNTVMFAYDRLIAEGYVVTQPRAGMFVNKKIPESGIVPQNPLAIAFNQGDRIRLGKNAPFSARAPALWQENAKRPQFDFSVGRSHPKSFPAKFWQRTIVRHLTGTRPPQTEYGDPRGLAGLRTAIARHLSTTRGIEAHPDQILVTAGVQGALNVLSRLFFTGSVNPSVAVENPGYQGAVYLFNSYGASIYPVDVDHEGLIVSRLSDFRGSLVYVTPSHQFPTGYTMTLERRLNLLDWAYRTGSFIIEDDYVGDFQYDGPALTPLAGIDRRGHVIYLGSFSRSIGPGLRIGYAVLPSYLTDQARITKILLDHCTPWHDQVVLTDFLNEGAFLRHIRRMRQIYRELRDTLVNEIEERFPGSILSGREGGTHLMWQVPETFPSAHEIEQVALGCGIGLPQFSNAAAIEYGLGGRLRGRSLILGYSALGADEIRQSMERLAPAIQSYVQG
jgi:GntR family transcriptional regulator/MocR family aminotransferase